MKKTTKLDYNEEWEEADFTEGVKDYHKWNRLGKGQSVSWSTVILVVILLGVVIAMITTDVSPFLERAVSFMMCK